MLEPFAKLGARIHGTSKSNGEQAVLKIPDNDTEDSSFEYPSEIETAAHHTMQLFGGGVDVDIKTMIVLPPRINLFLLLEPLPVRSHSLCNFSAGGRVSQFWTSSKSSTWLQDPRTGLWTPQTQRLSIIISTRPVLVTTTEGYRECGTECRMAQELGRSDGPKVKLAPYTLTAGDLGGFYAVFSTKGTGFEPWDSATHCRTTQRRGS